MKLENVRVLDFRVRVPAGLWPDIDIPAKNTSRYGEVLGVVDRHNNNRTIDDLMRILDQAGIDHTVLRAEHEFGDIADELNGVVAKLVTSAKSSGCCRHSRARGQVLMI